jgi:N-acetylmuramoyl-L-alanine amidase
MSVLPMKNRVTRKSWGARPPSGTTSLNRSKVKGIAVHYTASNADEQAEHKNCAARVRGIQNYHMNTQGWMDIAYNFIVCKHGYIFVGRGWFNRSAAQGTNQGNSEYLAVCFLGDDTKSRDDVTDAGREAFIRVFKRFNVWYRRKAVLRPHSAFTSTSCPGDELRRWIANL